MSHNPRPTVTLFTQTSDAVISNTTSELSQFGTGTGSLTIKAGSIIAEGQTIRIKVEGYLTETGGPTATIKVKFGGQTLVTSTGTLPNQGISNAYVSTDYDITFRTVGASGTVHGCGRTALIAGTLVTTQSRALVSANDVTIDTTVDNTIDVTYQFGTADPGNVLHITNAYVVLMK